MRLITWNINSVRLRLSLLLDLCAAMKPDVVCLQETKCPAEKFPAAPIAEAGYPHQQIAGFKGYNGVAILSRAPIQDGRIHNHVGREDARHVAGTIEGAEIHCLYVPAGGDVPDRTENEKFGHKLDFIDTLRDWFPATDASRRPVLACGDFNIAPLETDVWSHKQLLKVVSHTPVETEKLTAMQQAAPFTDAVRTFIPPEEKLFTWWSYRARDWRASDRGRRLDHIWVTEPLRPALRGAEVMKDARDWQPASDHVPVILDL